MVADLHNVGNLETPFRLWPLPEGFLALRAKKCLFHAVFAHFRPFLVFSSNLREGDN